MIKPIVDYVEFETKLDALQIKYNKMLDEATNNGDEEEIMRCIGLTDALEEIRNLF